MNIFSKPMVSADQLGIAGRRLAPVIPPLMPRGTAARRLHDYVRARFDHLKSPSKEIARRYGWDLSKARKIYSGDYAHVTADDVLLVVEVDGTPACDALLAVPETRTVEDHLKVATTHLEAALAAQTSNDKEKRHE